MSKNSRSYWGFAFAMILFGVRPSIAQTTPQAGPVHKDEMIVRDPNNKVTTVDAARAAIEAKLANKIPVTVKVRLIGYADPSLSKSKDKVVDVYFAASCKIKTKTNTLSENAPLRQEKIKTGITIRLGGITSADLSRENSITCDAGFNQDSGIKTSDRDQALKLIEQIQAYVSSQSGFPAASEVSKWIPLAPIAVGIIDLIFSDERLHTYTISLSGSDGFIPAADELETTGSIFKVRSLVIVGGYTFSKEIQQDALESLRVAIPLPLQLPNNDKKMAATVEENDAELKKAREAERADAAEEIEQWSHFLQR